MNISVLIPCHNEEKSVRKCLESVLSQTRKPDQIVVVNDASTDRTAQILKSFGRKIKIVELKTHSGGKSYAQHEGLFHVKGEVLVTTDSDSYLEPHFLERVERAFENRETAAFAGYVRSTRDNWLTSCRELDYALGQNLHKKAQSNIGYLYVIPGCAGAFRTKMFKKTIKFEHDTLTEDLDFTYKLHKAGQKVVYDDRAICYTQDPNNLKAFVNQTRRWYAGGWQNLFKHIGLVKKQPQAAMELSFAYIEGTVFAGLLFALPFINPRLYFSLMAVSMGIISIFAIYSARKSNRWDTLPSIFLMPMIYYIQAYIFFEQFVSVALIGQKNLTWYQPERSLAVQ